MNKQNEPPDQDKQEKERKERHTLEAIILVITAGLVLFMLAYSIYHALTTTGEPPRLSATPLFSKVEKHGNSYVLPVEIKNETKPTAEDVRVVVEITQKDGTVDDNEINIPYLAEHSKTEGYIVSKQQPTRDNVTVDIQSYKLP